ncbi:MAG: DUF11 domain-containing protein [Saprospiraceae bacterium]
MKALLHHPFRFALLVLVSMLMLNSVSAQHDLELLKTASTSTAQVGDQVTFTLVVNNDAGTTVNGVQVTDLLPAGVNYVSHQPAMASYDP